MTLCTMFLLCCLVCALQIVYIQAWTIIATRRRPISIHNEPWSLSTLHHGRPITRHGEYTTQRSTALALGLDSNDNDQFSSPSPHPSADISSPTNHISASHNNNSTVLKTNDDVPVLSNATQTLMKKIRVNKAEAVIEQILSGPDAPIDLESELSRVKSIAPPLPDTMEPSQFIASLEQDLHTSIQNQNYEAASAVKHQLDQAHVDDCGAVLHVNAAFYRAFSMRDLDAMQNIWCDDNTCTCIHPGSVAPIVGSRNVRQNWQQLLLEQPAGTAFQSVWMEPKNIRLTVKGQSWAILSCEEWVYTRRFRRGKRKETRLVNQCIATNVFRKVPDTTEPDNVWKLTHHHSSFHVHSPAATNTRPEHANGNDADGVGDTMEGILGRSSLAADIGQRSIPDQRNNLSTPKVIVGSSLSDLLNGNLGDLLASADDEDDNGHTGTVIQFRQSRDGDSASDITQMEYTVEIDDADDEEDEDGDEEENDNGDTDVDGSPSLSFGRTRRMSSKNDFRHQCIQTIRRLAKQGLLSPNQKRTLLTDMIYCSANGTLSTVEVAYQLLCTEDIRDGDDAPEEDFADQCRVLAASMRQARPSEHDSTSS